MPARTNEFQKLVLFLKQGLAASSRVTESKLVEARHSDGAAAEVGSNVSYGKGVTGFGKTFMSIAEDAPGRLRGEFAFKDPATGNEATVRFGDEQLVTPPKAGE